jgi:hypothetical protein
MLMPGGSVQILPDRPDQDLKALVWNIAEPSPDYRTTLMGGTPF